MKSAKNDKVYKSPERKLVRFFEKSRDNWKRKYKEAKKTSRYLKDRMRSLEKSRAYWKEQAREANEKLKIYEVEKNKKKRNSQKTLR
jgi:hypothetical protein